MPEFLDPDFLNAILIWSLITGLGLWILSRPGRIDPRTQHDVMVALLLSLPICLLLAGRGPIAIGPAEWSLSELRASVRELPGFPGYRGLAAALRPEHARPVYEAIDKSMTGGLVSAIWALVAVGLGWRTFRRARRVQELVRTSSSASKAAQALVGRLSKNSRATVRLVPGLSSPFVAGFLNPVIYVPEAETDLELVLRHELAHVESRDVFVVWVETALAALLWFHPLVWLARKSMHLARERDCDQQATENTCRVRYARLLQKYAIVQTTDALLPFASPTSEVGRRIQALKDDPPQRHSGLRRIGLMSLVLLSTVLLGTTHLRFSDESLHVGFQSKPELLRVLRDRGIRAGQQGWYQEQRDPLYESGILRIGSGGSVQHAVQVLRDLGATNVLVSESRDDFFGEHFSGCPGPHNQAPSFRQPPGFWNWEPPYVYAEFPMTGGPQILLDIARIATGAAICDWEGTTPSFVQLHGMAAAEKQKLKAVLMDDVNVTELDFAVPSLQTRLTRGNLRTPNIVTVGRVKVAAPYGWSGLGNEHELILTRDDSTAALLVYTDEPSANPSRYPDLNHVPEPFRSYLVEGLRNSGIRDRKIPDGYGWSVLPAYVPGHLTRAWKGESSETQIVAIMAGDPWTVGTEADKFVDQLLGDVLSQIKNPQ